MTLSARGPLATLSLSMLLASLGTSIANVALPTLAQAFHASFQQVQWVVIAYLVSITIFIVSVGRLGDLTGRRRLMLAGLSVFTIASMACGAAPTLPLLIAARMLQGLGAAVMMALTMALVGETVSPSRTGSAMGVLGTMSAIGTALGPSLGGLLITGFGWRSIFFINLPLGVLTLFLAWCFLPADRDELKANRGRFEFGMLRRPALSASLAMSFLVTTVVMATLVVGPFYLSGVVALDTAHVGLVMSAGPIVSALTGVPSGRVVDRFGADRMSIAGLTAMMTGASVMSLLPAQLGIPGYVAPLVLITAGYALFQAAINTAVMTSIRPDERGAVSGMLHLSRNLGLIAGASVMSAVFAFGVGATNIVTAPPESITAGMHLAYAVAAALILLALTIAFVSRTLVVRPSSHGELA